VPFHTFEDAGNAYPKSDMPQRLVMAGGCLKAAWPIVTLPTRCGFRPARCRRREADLRPASALDSCSDSKPNSNALLSTSASIVVTEPVRAQQ